ncbi:tripartite tricarboxylate transporter substrate binding protein [Variovorax sp. OV329]|uniref:Bug family tripartite tricarboxylate transporter substrate binding protein n=1 Tax=Variovorax sp. OV329 TaxID=1882825 RepID=UPI0008F31E51|nr:tripartite tricarboxylate transporter substrate binding protein [Variovorax sp. OV329]SFM10565.1 Tripartite-type tricarboxylate transporter, receptor component TctC [Variovorax sp. OV329]
MNTLLPSAARRACVAALLSAIAWSGAYAQAAWPNRPIRLLVPAPAGGASDMIARTVAESVRASTGQAVIVDNKPGAGGLIAVDALLSAPHDGYTFVLSPNSLVTEGPYSYKFRIDPLKDLAPVAEVAKVALVLVANPSLPIRSAGEMVAYVKANPGKVTYASYSPGSLSHIEGLQFNRAAGLDMEHAGYKGSPPALVDVMGGQVQFMFDGMGTSLPLIKAGKLRPLAVTSPQRSPFLPDVPALAELGYGSLSQTMGTGVWSTPDVPPEIRGELRAQLQKAIATPAVREQLAALGMETANPTQSTEDWTRALKRDYEHTGQLLRSIDYKP